MKTRHPILILALFVAALGALASCGEVPMKRALGDDTRKVEVISFENKTGQPGIDQQLTAKVVQSFITDGRLGVVSREAADVSLKGVVQRYDRLVLSRDADQVPQQYRLQVVVDLEFSNVKTGEVLWTTKRTFSLTPGVDTVEDFDSTNTRSLKEFTSYYVLNTAGVSPEDEPSALDRLLEQMARRVVRRVLEGF